MEGAIILNSNSQFPALTLALFAMGMFFLWRKGDKKQASSSDPAQAGPATAKVIEVGDSSNTLADNLRIALRLEVYPAYGPSYEAISIWRIEPAHVQDVQAGKTLAVKIDSKNPKIIFPDDSLSWASSESTRELKEPDFSYSSKKGDKGMQAGADQAGTATAKIIEIGNSYNERGWGVSVALRLEVTPPVGDPYPVISVWEVQPAHMGEIQVGKTLAIKIDGKNAKVIYPADNWAQQTYTKEYTEDDMWN